MIKVIVLVAMIVVSVLAKAECVDHTSEIEITKESIATVR